MINWSDVVPVTVVAAIAIFGIKEILEFRRRKIADVRKLSALKKLFARECELNAWTIKALVRIFQGFKDDPSDLDFVTIATHKSGHVYLHVQDDSKNLLGQTWVPSVQREAMSKYSLDVATLSEEFYGLVEIALDGLAQTQHVRDYILQLGEENTFLDRSDYSASLADYSLEELADAQDALKKLYTYCTGKILEGHRLR
ncbi:hypothetical protein JAB1_14570 [Janthinobacterium sp. MP5059B]|uniref:hypothetical protein n=1 Tax=Janthinobacterium sp. MP5059B TaxID=1766683 RepID=UPI000892DA4C|nr:hypothetical protein [Janthinobacterium sp. MP5059B]OEZ50342.1 hypothetical protein JAB1_14570 [Janthinobacterium sp. MP5059B]